MTFGVLGNGIVLLVYSLKIRKSSNYRLYVLSLAVLDITACVTGIPGLMYDMLHPYTFYSSIACKLHRYGYHVVACASSMTHFLIGIERHRKICKPLLTQISQSISKLIIVFIFILAFVIAIPAFFIYGIYTFSVYEYNITAAQCHVDDNYVNTPYPFGYDVILLVLVVSVVLGLCICYVQIGHQLLKSESIVFPSNATFNGSVGRGLTKEKAKTFKENENIRAETIQNNSNPKNIAVDQSATKELEGNQEVIQKDTPSSETSGVDVSNYWSKTDTRNSVVTRNMKLQTEDQMHQRSQKPYSVRQISVESRSQKVTLITFVLTVIFIVSYIPYLSCVIVDAISGEVRDGMTSTQEAWYQIGTMSYVISNAANPYVYLAMDKVFRSHCQNILCYICFHRKKKDNDDTWAMPQHGYFASYKAGKSTLDPDVCTL